jgi:hypothetical protein
MKISATFLALLAAGGPAFAVDLTPRYIDTFEAGVASHRLYFADGERKIGISLDRETDVVAGGGGVIFRFPKFPEASFLVKHSPVTADQPFSGVPLERYREAARRLVPPGSTEVKVRDEARDPLTINRWRSYRLAYTFAAGTTPMVQQITFLNLTADEQLVLVTTASERNFAEASARSFQIIRSWQPMLPGDEKPIREN